MALDPLTVALVGSSLLSGVKGGDGQELSSFQGGDPDNPTETGSQRGGRAAQTWPRGLFVAIDQ